MSSRIRYSQGSPHVNTVPNHSKTIKTRKSTFHKATPLTKLQTSFKYSREIVFSVLGSQIKSGCHVPFSCSDPRFLAICDSFSVFFFCLSSSWHFGWILVNDLEKTFLNLGLSGVFSWLDWGYAPPGKILQRWSVLSACMPLSGCMWWCNVLLVMWPLITWLRSYLPIFSTVNLLFSLCNY